MSRHQGLRPQDCNVVKSIQRNQVVVRCCRWTEATGDATLHPLHDGAGVTLTDSLVAFVAIADRIVCADLLLWFGCFREMWSLLASLLSPTLHGVARGVKPLELTWAATQGLC